MRLFYHWMILIFIQRLVVSPFSVFPLSFSQQAHNAYERPMDSLGCLLNYLRCSFIIPFVLAYVASYQRHDLHGSLLCVQDR